MAADCWAVGDDDDGANVTAGGDRMRDSTGGLSVVDFGSLSFLLSTRRSADRISNCEMCARILRAVSLNVNGSGTGSPAFKPVAGARACEPKKDSKTWRTARLGVVVLIVFVVSVLGSSTFIGGDAGHTGQDDCTAAGGGAGGGDRFDGHLNCSHRVSDDCRSEIDCAVVDVSALVGSAAL